MPTIIKLAKLEPPRCFDSREHFDQWRYLEHISNAGMSRHCTDCLPAYQQRMKLEGRCEHPLTRFAVLPTIDGDWETVGVRANSHKPGGGRRGMKDISALRRERVARAENAAKRKAAK